MQRFAAAKATGDKMKKVMILLVLVLSSALSFAQAEPSTKAVDSWLNIIDNSQYAKSYQATAPLFKEQLTEQKWVEALEQVRKPLGKVVSRQMKEAKEVSDLPGVPKGEYLVVMYQTDFENKAAAIETVTFKKESDTWLAAGYFIR